MTYTAVLAQSTVSDTSAAEPWYTALLGRAPDTGGGARLLRLTDPDGNRVVVLGR